MFFGQRPHPLNFAYGRLISPVGDEARRGVEIQAGTGRLRVGAEELFQPTPSLRLLIENRSATDPAPHSDGLLPEARSGTLLEPRLLAPDHYAFAAERAGITADVSPAGLRLTLPGGLELAPPGDGTGLGQNGPQTIVRLAIPHAVAAYGLGERTGRLNKLGTRADFLTIDVLGVNPLAGARTDYDPCYVSVPFVILRFGDGRHCGLYFDSGERLNMDLGQGEPGILSVVAPDGPLPLHVLPGPGLHEVVRQFTALSGRAPIPPPWALGYHQCRWGYRTEDEFRALAADFKRHDVPVSALWFDIDHTRGFRTMTWDPKTFPNPAALTAELNAAAIRTVAIVNPGVKREPGWDVYDEGAAAEVFCRAKSGRDYVGRVWPGDAVFPDFTLDATRRWWATRLATFLRDSGLDGAWLDMNDPSTGDSSPEEMRWDHGRLPHARWHNQYGHLMSLASRAAFEQNDVLRRFFLLTRSAFTGTQRHAAVWTGDNHSNWPHLRMCLPQCLNLGLSGMAFCGPDVGGFGGHCDAELLTRWTQACFLFPFFRNHCETTARPQEPWAFGAPTLERIRGAIRARYRLLPYLYQLFVRHWLEGDPVLRPMCYEWPDAALRDVDDQFMVGDSLLAAPMLWSREERPPVLVNGRSCQHRSVVLPPGRWFDLAHARWEEGGRTIQVAVSLDECPLFARDGSALPYYAGPVNNSRVSFRELELHIFSSEEPARLSYYYDDLSTRAYEGGHLNRIDIEAALSEDEADLLIEARESGPMEPGAVHFTPVLYPPHDAWSSDTPPVQCHLRRDGQAEPEHPMRLSTRRWLLQDLTVLA